MVRLKWEIIYGNWQACLWLVFDCVWWFIFKMVWPWRGTFSYPTPEIRTQSGKRHRNIGSNRFSFSWITGIKMSFRNSCSSAREGFFFFLRKNYKADTWCPTPSKWFLLKMFYNPDVYAKGYFYHHEPLFICLPRALLPFYMSIYTTNKCHIFYYMPDTIVCA